MRLEFAATNYSTFMGDLLQAPARQASGGGHTAAADGGGIASARGCAGGLLRVQVVVEAGGEAVAEGGGGSGWSASEVRPLHWLPPPPPLVPPAATNPALPPGGGATASSSSAAAVAAAAATGATTPASGPPGSAAAELRPGVASPPPGTSDWCAAADAFACAAAAGPAPAPLGVSSLEWLVLRLPWYRFGLCAFAAQWGALAGAALLAALLARRGPAAPAPAWRAAARQLVGAWLRRLRLVPRATRGGRGAGGGGQVVGGGDREGSRCREMEARGGAAADEGGLSAAAAGGGGAGDCGGAGDDGCAEAAPLLQCDTQQAASSSAGPSPRGPRRSRSGGNHGGGGPAVTAAQAPAEAASRPTAVPDRPPLLLRLWPLRDFAALARRRPSPWFHGPWLALLSYWAYLAVGPWLLAEFVAGEGPAPTERTGRYGVLTVYGIFMPWSGGWTTAPSLDFAVIVNAVWALNVAPAALLCASAAARLGGLAAAGQLQGGRRGAAADVTGPVAVAAAALLSPPQAVALLSIGVVNVLLGWKLWAGLGWAPVLVSPGVGWLLPLTVTWLYWARRCAVTGAAAASGSTGAMGRQRWHD
ncbi:hypothetical protein TSOC_014689 [Tetrabaena socialis]|uniref:Uncharacterized protein n=1 Tax=Tetrabaena socialis TaxID=47790 RepID=A0A2J7ZH20_9CHLO|nr:hypothetical protein TSOC_014689 [Tetrabaena socialis]|eukprot:PNG99529.1 hypothetical protein TSOC_014689 [Tetrabaena socialis]